MLDTVKVPEKLIGSRLAESIRVVRDLFTRQFDVRIGRSTVGAIELRLKELVRTAFDFGD